MNAVGRFITYSNVDATSIPERVGDFLLTPARVVFSGKKFVLLKQEENYTRMEAPAYSVSSQKILRRIPWIIPTPWIMTAFKIILIPGLILIPLGLLFKTISLVCKSTRLNYQNWTQPIVIGKKNFTKEAYFAIVNHPLRYLSFRYNFFEASQYAFNPLKLTECACPSFDRLQSARRQEIENLFLAGIPTLAVLNGRPLKLMSLGCGNLLSEFILMGRLLQLGYKIELDLIDSSTKKKTLDKLIFLYQKLNLSIEISHYENIEPYKKTLNLDAVLAMDFDFDGENEASKDLAKAQTFLAQNGKCFLGYENGTLIWHQNNQIDIPNEKGWVATFASSAHENIAKLKKDSIHIGILQTHTALTFVVGALKGIQQCKTGSVKVTLLKSTSKNCSIENLSTYIRKMLPDAEICELDEGTPSKEKFDLLGPVFSCNLAYGQSNLSDRGCLYAWDEKLDLNAMRVYTNSGNTILNEK